ncbi:MAG: hypothetical protein HN356_06410 [Calditrichaeota bacterium]|jgi:hypothetical protein|nr:hypothetical protein [Calditrichota bacterium]MBT7616992.1 hypothetical protein [Calditrichota bacterium]MBT7787714.1 hypothetical protein [Calditrichota bacterium]
MNRKNITKAPKLNDQQHKGWGSLLFAVAMVVVFMFIVAPGLLRITAIKNMAICIEESNIEATAIWWSEVELVSDAEINCRNSILYSPVKPKETKIR